MDLAQAAIVALGSNLGDSAATLRRAAARLREFSASPVKASSIWRTDPVDCPPDSPSFLNAIVALAPFPDETPDSLLAKLLALETEFGRRRSGTINEARVLDLDLIAFRQERRSSPLLTLPHPRAVERAFVLAPLAELDPNYVLPGRTRPVAQCLAAPDVCRLNAQKLGVLLSEFD